MHRKAEEERIDFFLTTENWQGEIINMERDKCDELKWFPLDDLPQNTIPYIRRAIDNFKSGKRFDTYGF